jgi:hypothetical protein
MQARKSRKQQDRELRELRARRESHRMLENQVHVSEARSMSFSEVRLGWVPGELAELLPSFSMGRYAIDFLIGSVLLEDHGVAAAVEGIFAARGYDLRNPSSTDAFLSELMARGR